MLLRLHVVTAHAYPKLASIIEATYLMNIADVGLVGELWARLVQARK